MTSSSSPFGPPPLPPKPADFSTTGLFGPPPALPPARDPYLAAALDRIAVPGFAEPPPPGPNTLAGWNTVIQAMNEATARPAPEFGPPPETDPWAGESATLAAIEAWLKAKAAHAKAQRIERDLRTQMLKLAFPLINWDLGSFSDWTGTHRYKMPEGVTLKVVLSDKYEIENSDEMDTALAKLPEETAEAMVSWKPSLSKEMYLALSAENRKIMSPYVTIKGNSPQAEIEGNE